MVVSEADRLSPALDAVQSTVQAFDLACSRFRDDSELSALVRAGGRPVRVSGLFLEALRAGLRAAELTDGDVDPTLGSALLALGYDRDASLLGETSVPRITVAPVAGWRAVHVEGDMVRLDPGVSLDLGATAKALAADHAAAAAAQRAQCGVLVSLGGDLAISGPAPAEGWRVRITDDHRAEAQAPGQWIALRSGALATSSTTVRRWSAGGETVHHLLDPRTGRPVAGDWRTASVTAASCLDANIASTAAIVRGRRALSWLVQEHLPSRLVSQDGRAVHLAGWPVEGEDLPSLDVGVDAEVPV